MAPKQRSAVCTWDITVSADKWDKESLKEWFMEKCKRWVFQLEAGEETGFRHFQCRVSLKVRSRTPLPMENVHPNAWSVTSNENKDEDFYCIKEHTRIDGPWSDKDHIVWIPPQYRGLGLRPWQQQIVDISKVFDTRTIHVVYDPIGNKGKSTLASLVELEGKGLDLPPVNDMTTLVGMACNICMAKKERYPNPIFMDMPRAIEKSKLYGVYCAIEQMKKGKLYDLRYHYKEWWIASPAIWVFTNKVPDLELLSRDRWSVWCFNAQGDTLVKMAIGPRALLTPQEGGG